MSVLDDIFGGGKEHAAKKAARAIQHNYEQARAQLQPYSDAGQRGLSNYESYLGQFEDPQAYQRSILEGYSLSPEAQFDIDEGLNAYQQSARAGGLPVSSNMLRASQEFGQNLANRDRRQYLQDILGIGSIYGGGQFNLAQMGQNAAGGLAGLYSDEGQQLAPLKYNQVTAHADALTNAIGTGLSLAAAAPLGGFSEGIGAGFKGLGKGILKAIGSGTISLGGTGTSGAPSNIGWATTHGYA